MVDALLLLLLAELLGTPETEDDEDEDEELHPASARAATTIAGRPARADMRRVRRDRVIAALS
jgi:hypothetical protein